jgi:NAD(P)-dependent dehydrogenase (short-subunit alcohol dehydrogenase family)
MERRSSLEEDREMALDQPPDGNAMTDRLTVVTGAASGMGRTIAAQFLGQSERVVGLDIRPPAPFDTDRWTGLVCDVSDEQAWAAAMSEIVSDLGAPDALINVAGISARTQKEPASPAAWMEILRIDLLSTWLGMRAVVPHMTAHGSGKIVNIGALAAHQPFAVPDLAGYSAAKAGVEAITRATALEVAPAGVAVNCVAPGPIETPMAASLTDEARAQILDPVPMKRIGKPEEVAELVAFLASERSGFITGQVILIDGGISVGAHHRVRFTD